MKLFRKITMIILSIICYPVFSQVADPELEKAWVCDPKIIEYGSNNWALHLQNPACNPERAVYPTSDRPGMVQMPPESKASAALILKTYNIKLSDKSTFAEFNNEKSARDKIRQEMHALKEAEKKKELEQREASLRSGATQIATMSDAFVVYPEGDGNGLLKLADSPLLSPNLSINSGYVVIDYLEKEGLIRAKATAPISIYMGAAGKEYRYIYLQITRTSKIFNSDLLRIGSTAMVVGKYTKNMQYKTVLGELKSAPLLEVMFIGNK